jgi:hypothetical protein
MPSDGNTSDYFLKRASECEQLATTAESDALRELMLYIAARWRSFIVEDSGGQQSEPPDGWSVPPLR